MPAKLDRGRPPAFAPGDKVGHMVVLGATTARANKSVVWDVRHEPCGHRTTHGTTAVRDQVRCPVCPPPPPPSAFGIRDADVVRHLVDHSTTVTCREFGVTRPRVQQILARTLQETALRKAVVRAEKDGSDKRRSAALDRLTLLRRAGRLGLDLTPFIGPPARKPAGPRIGPARAV